MFGLFLQGIAAMFAPKILLLLILGVGIGIIFGAIPGLTAVMAIALFLPVTYSMSAVEGMAILMALYVGSVSGGVDLCYPSEDPRHTGLDRNLFRRTSDGRKGASV